MATAQELGAGGIDGAGKPIFVATEHTRFSAREDRELSDQEQLAWKSFQLWRTSLSIERRDSVYQTITNGDYTNFNLTRHIMGTPYPVIDNTPSILNTAAGVRMYEHGISFLVAYSYSMWVRSKASLRHVHLHRATRMSVSFGTFMFTDLCFWYRSMFRLSGFLPNDYECRKFGVMESQERLEQKKEMWEKYSAYKREWCRRFDYHVYGIRPGETLSLFSACWLPAWGTSYGTVTDYPLRKNPYFLSATPLRDMYTEYSFTIEPPRSANSPLPHARPEVLYTFRGPRVASDSNKPWMV
ncbi:NADH-ubiquinone oxidoreductase complex I, 21 kDa subunit [Novymonas esmeraldas]|uniref:NADH-ubiquinone oxidoreductase complex I, 21 kDa subunit n=1 Tax=Novymonas esmeraldas TaxID=1808958 RepID=A0AAW0EVA6_9TRYP